MPVTLAAVTAAIAGKTALGFDYEKRGLTRSGK